jgi:hypothetical protein
MNELCILYNEGCYTNELANRYQILVNKGIQNFNYPKIVSMYEDSAGAIGSQENKISLRILTNVVL